MTIKQRTVMHFLNSIDFELSQSGKIADWQSIDYLEIVLGRYLQSTCLLSQYQSQLSIQWEDCLL